jgi:hypothetical protein
MRIAPKLVAALILSPILVLIMAESRYAPVAFGQIGGTPPAPAAPIAPPPAPGAPAALPSVGALPRLAPAPGTERAARAASPLPTPRLFACSCAGPGFPVGWVGKVPAPSYILARQQATRACVSYNLNANANSPYIPPPSFGFQQQLPPRPGTFNSIPPGQVSLPRGFIIQNQPLQSGTSTGSNVAALLPQQCTNCACN